jgi:rare lipoprotein A
VNTTPHGRGVSLRKPAIATLTLAAAAGASALGPATADAASPFKLTTSKNVLVGRSVNVSGRLAGPGHENVLIQRAYGSSWRTVARARTGASGRFHAHLRVRRIGRGKVRAVGPARVKSPLRRATVYRAVAASYYGPGLYGSRLACGGRLTPSKIGVANKTLPCGTRVHFRYRGRNLVAPVIDRGPYVAGRTYDLTSATKHRLHFGSTGTVWASR